MNTIKNVGMDVHLPTSTCVVLDADGKELISTVLQTKAEFITSFLKSLNGTVHLTFEEGSLAQWLFELTEPVVARVVVCNPREHSSKGVKNDRMDARKLANLLRLNALKPVYHQRRSVIAQIKQRVASYQQLLDDRTRTRLRLRSVFREQAMTVCLDDEVKFAEAIQQLPSVAHRERVEFLVEEFTAIDRLVEQAKAKMLAAAGQEKAYQLLQSLPGISVVRAAQLLGWVGSPHRFRTKRQFWSYCGLSVITRSSSDHQVKNGSIVKRQKMAATRGLNQNYHRRLKAVFKGAALSAIRNKQINQLYQGYVERGLKESIARVQLARKLAASCLVVWKTGKEFEIEKFIKASD